MKLKIMNPHKLSAHSDNKQKSYGMLLIELVTWSVTNRDVLLLATIQYLLALKLMKKPRTLRCLCTTYLNKHTPFNRDIVAEKNVKNDKHRATFFLKSRVSVCKVRFLYQCSDHLSHSKNFTFLFPLIFLSKHISLYALGRIR